MLKISYHPSFKGNENIVLITGDKESYLEMSKFLKSGQLCDLAASPLVVIENLYPLSPAQLALTKEECLALSQICLKLTEEGTPGHEYLSLKNIQDADLMVSYGEYV